MKLAVVGSGISGLVAARELCREHEVTVYEAADWVGGHTHTVDVEVEGRRYAIDTGFIVFNTETYPRFVGLLRELGVAWQPSDMSFSVKDEASGLEYGSSSLGAFLAQRANLVRPGFWRMTRDILRFNREAPRLLEAPDDALTLGEYLRRERYSREFMEQHMLPLGAAVWSAPLGGMLEFPATTFVRFFQNHGFLRIAGRTPWLTIRGGSREYVGPLTAPFAERIRLRSPVRAVRREADHVALTSAAGVERYDRVILATHADTSLRLLVDASPRERELLECFPYQENAVVLHTDTALLPRRRAAWASWNARLLPDDPGRVTVTYLMNRLQTIAGPPWFCVSLNEDPAIDPGRVLRRFTYHHPIYTPRAVAAQARHAEIDGADRVHFCGAYWGYGFHEDGVVSGLRAARRVQAAARRRPALSA